MVRRGAQSTQSPGKKTGHEPAATGDGNEDYRPRTVTGEHNVQEALGGPAGKASWGNRLTCQEQISRLRDRCPCQVQQTVSERKTRIAHVASEEPPGRQQAGPGRPVRQPHPRGGAGHASTGPAALTRAVPSGGTPSGVGEGTPLHARHIEPGRVSLGHPAHRHAEREHQPRRRGLGAASPEPAEESGRLGASASGPAPGIKRQGAVR